VFDEQDAAKQQGPRQLYCSYRVSYRAPCPLRLLKPATLHATCVFLQSVIDLNEDSSFKALEHSQRGSFL